MGARESTSRNAKEETSVVDYYEVLEVSEDATSEEIKVHRCLLPQKCNVGIHIDSGRSAVWHWFTIPIKITQM